MEEQNRVIMMAITNLGIIKRLELILAVLLILNGNSVYHAASPTGNIIDILLYVTLFLLMAFTKYSGNEKPQYSFLLFVIIPIWVLIFFIHNPLNFFRGFMLFGVSLPVFSDYFIWCNRHNKEYDLLYKISDVMFLISVVSLCFWFLGSYSGLISTNIEIKASWGDDISSYLGYYGVHFNAQLEDGTFFENEMIYRNSSVFLEAPMFNLWLMISLTIELFLKQKVIVPRVLIFVVCILTTMSTTGMLFVMLIFFIYFLSLTIRRKRKAFFLKGVFLIPMILIAAYTVYITIEDLLEMKSDTSSSTNRMLDIFWGFSVFLEHPIWGVGYMNTLNRLFGASNTFSAMLAQCGLYLCSIIYFPIVVYLIRSIRKRNFASLGMIILFVFTIYTTTIYKCNIYMLFPSLFYGEMLCGKRKVGLKT